MILLSDLLDSGLVSNLWDSANPTTERLSQKWDATI